MTPSYHKRYSKLLLWPEVDSGNRVSSKSGDIYDANFHTAHDLMELDPQHDEELRIRASALAIIEEAEKALNQLRSSSFQTKLTSKLTSRVCTKACSILTRALSKMPSFRPSLDPTNDSMTDSESPLLE